MKPYAVLFVVWLGLVAGAALWQWLRRLLPERMYPYSREYSLPEFVLSAFSESMTIGIVALAFLFVGI